MATGACGEPAGVLVFDSPIHMPQPPVSSPLVTTPLVALDLPLIRLQGISVAGEQTVVQAPELGVCFDIGLCPRPARDAGVLALSHGHIDHVGGLLYYLAHRHLRAAPAVVLCHPLLRQPIETLMDASAGMAGERTAYRLVAIDHDETFDLGEDLRLRAFRTLHTVPSLGYVLLRGDEPLLCYTGDTAWGIHFQREDVQRARVLVTECTFWDPAHRATAHRTGHLHLGDIVSLLELVGAEAVVLTHVPRQLDLQRTRKLLDVAIPPRHRHRLHVMLRP